MAKCLTLVERVVGKGGYRAALSRAWRRAQRHLRYDRGGEACANPFGISWSGVLFSFLDPNRLFRLVAPFPAHLYSPIANGASKIRLGAVDSSEGQAIGDGFQSH